MERATLNTLRVLASLALLGVLQAPVYAQLPERPHISPSDGMSPDPLERSPTPGTLRSLSFGDQVAHHNNTALIWERGFPDFPEAIGRVAVFTRNGQGKWVRSASIDAPSGNVGFGEQIAIFNDFALIESTTHAFLYHRVQGQWKRIQQLTPQSGYTFTEVTIWNNWAFIGARSATAGAVHVYQFTTAGTLRGVQTLRSFSGDPADGFGEHVVISNARALVSASGDTGGRGAAYVFELSGSLFVKRQKLIAINGARGDGFAASIGISADWIAIGAPNVDGVQDLFCLGGRTTGAMYVFRRINGTWLQQDALLSGDARDTAFSCVTEFGAQLMISGAWLVSTITVDNGAVRSVVPVIYKRDTTTFTARADAAEADGSLDLYLSNGTLIVGAPFEQGCQFEACVGRAVVYDLDKTGL